MVYPCSTSSIWCWGLYHSIVSEVRNRRMDELNIWTCTIFLFFFVQKQINSMIKITYKVQSFAFKAWLRVFLKQFNIDQSQRESLLQYFVTRFSDDMTRLWRGSMENTDRSQSSSTCMRWRRGWWWYLKWQVGLSTDWHLLHVHKKHQCIPHKNRLIISQQSSNAGLSEPNKSKTHVGVQTSLLTGFWATQQCLSETDHVLWPLWMGKRK